MPTRPRRRSLTTAPSTDRHHHTVDNRQHAPGGYPSSGRNTGHEPFPLHVSASARSGAAMARVEKEKAAEIGAFLSRYMSARCRCVGATAQRGAIGLAYLVQHGVRRFDEIHIEPDA